MGFQFTFAYATGLSYVSCSPYRVPIARLAAAQGAISSQALQPWLTIQLA
jgi:pyruvate,orthophosphate dikinase